MPPKQVPDHMRMLNAVTVIQRFIGHMNSQQQPDPQARKRLIKKFILNYEKENNEPIINISQELRNEAFRLYCAILIQRTARAHHRRVLIQLRTYPIYKSAARFIFSFYKSKRSSQNQFLKQKKCIRIQRLARAFLFKNKFAVLQNKIKSLSDPKQTNPLQLLKLLEPNNAELIKSFGEGFVVRFRLSDEQALNEAKNGFGKFKILGPIKQIFNPKIYFKIFLKQKVVDIAETAPRNYAAEMQTNTQDRRLWYVRFTNQPWKRLNGNALEAERYVAKPVITVKEVADLKKTKNLRWKNKMREEWLLEKMGVKNLETDQALLDWCQKIDYYQYENEWKDMATNTYEVRKLITEAKYIDPQNTAIFHNDIENQHNSGLMDDFETEDGGFRID
ncbi:Conserved_hypothetical protein [Hexamita inflata]|uniref:Uncharacterized protein n=1 Tax=Hexamita inflata TaxID=28002 RepID=A0AA86P936_9EUKA|nr:Conserved hypothetical protein [Hexamita inflata]